MFGRKRKLADFNAEIDAHLKLEIERLQEQGLSEEQAQAAAHRAFGNVTKAQERFYESARWLWWDRLWQDIRFGARMLRKSPGFAAVAILTLALGIGANTAMFSALDCIVLKALPYPNPSQLVDLHSTALGGCPIPDFLRIRAESRTLGAMALYVNGPEFVLTGAGQPEELRSDAVSADFFPLFSVPPLLGRWFLSSDAQLGSERVVILSYPLWRDSFGSDPHVVGRKITLSDKPYGVVGVMPPTFDFPQQFDPETRLWLPLAPTPHDMTIRFGGLGAIARTRPGSSLADVQTELGVISSHLDKSDPSVYKNMRYWATPVKEEILQWAQALLLTLLAITGFVLLIACANLANLFLSRGWARRPEMAVRATLGATRWRVVRQLLVECVLLSLAGGAAGFLLAFSGIGTLRHLLPAYTPRLDELRIDPAALWFTLGISLLAAVLFGLAPALMVSRQDPNEVMKEGGSRSSGALSSRGGRWLRDVLVAGEVGLAFFLVLSAGLAIRGLTLLSITHFGFRTDHLLTFSIPPPRVNRGGGFDAPQVSREILLKLRALPPVESAAGEGPNWGQRPVHVQGMPDSDVSSLPISSLVQLTPNYFATMGIPFKAGHDFTETAAAGGAPLVAVVNESFARRYFQGSNPVDKQITMHGLDFNHPTADQVIRIIGEVGDTKNLLQPRVAPWPTVYLDYYQYPAPSVVSPVLRTASDPMLLAPAIRAVVASTWSNRPIVNMETVEQEISRLTTSPRAIALLLGTFGALGLFLAAVGIYGVISYSVVQRTHEIGVRMAMGAQPADVLRLIIGQGTRPVMIGIALGFSAAWALKRLLHTLVFVAGLKVSDPLTFVAVAFLLAAVALAACYIPARRAMRVDPLVALRHE